MSRSRVRTLLGKMLMVFLTHSHDDHDGNAFYCLDKGAQGILMGDLPPFSPAVTETYMNVTGMACLCTEDVGSMSPVC